MVKIIDRLRVMYLFIQTNQLRQENQPIIECVALQIFQANYYL